MLGAVEAMNGDGVAMPLGGVRLHGLLARLALDAGRPVASAVLVDDLWGADPPDGAANALQALVSRLRRAIGAEVVATDARGYRLHVGSTRPGVRCAQHGLDQPLERGEQVVDGDVVQNVTCMFRAVEQEAERVGEVALGDGFGCRRWPASRRWCAGPTIPRWSPRSSTTPTR